MKSTILAVDTLIPNSNTLPPIDCDYNLTNFNLCAPTVWSESQRGIAYRIMVVGVLQGLP